jgi:hypothetical protein
MVTSPTDGEITPDSDAAEEFADEVSVDPTQDEIDTYLRLEGDDTAEPPAAINAPSAD